jgi:hypothetical protein
MGLQKKLSVMIVIVALVFSTTQNRENLLNVPITRTILFIELLGYFIFVNA